MKVLPVIARELRSQARQPFTYWLRALAVGALLAGGWWFVQERGLEPNNGGRLFCQMHLFGYCALWILVPLGAADCISRERREGTLGLLFLTPLRPPHIVIAKGVVHGLRAVTLVVAVVPVLTIPFLLGGVMWQQVVWSVSMYFNATCWCLAAALVGSALARTNHRALAFAALLAAGGFLALPWAAGLLVGINTPASWQLGYSQSTYDFLTGFSLVAMPGGSFGDLLRFITPAQLLFAGSMAVAISIAVLVFAVLLAANRVRQAWRDEPPSLRAQQIEKTFCRPVVAKGLLRRWMARLLDRNPIGWLERRQWSGRLVTWTWFAIIVTLYSFALADSNFLYNASGVQNLLGSLLALSMAVTAAGSFRRERETGVLELLLVSPLTVPQIVHGRLWGLWGQFLPAVVAYLGLRLYFDCLFHRFFASRPGDGGGLAAAFYFAVTFAVVPVIGLYFSLVSRFFVAALVATLVVAVVVPMALFMTLQFLLWAADSTGTTFRWFDEVWKVQWFFQLLMATFLFIRLQRKLERRTFVAERTAD